MAKETVTYSELRARRRCAYRAHLEYDQGIAPKITTPGLREGTIADAGMNALYEHVRTAGEYSYEVMLAAMREAEKKESERIASVADLFEEEWQILRERAELLESVALRYVDFAQEHDPFDRVVSVQFSGRVPVLSPKGHASTKYDYAFKADGLVLIDGELWLLENKWWKTVDRNALASLQMDEQCGMYLWGTSQAVLRQQASPDVLEAFAEYGSPVGVCYNIIRKKLPTTPALLKNGTTSRDKSIDTTAEVYRRTLELRGQDLADYAEILEILEAKGETFFLREAVHRNAEEIEEIGRRIWEGTRLRAEGHRLKFPTRDCIWECSYRPLCIEWSDELFEGRYRIKTSAHEELEEELEEAA